MNIHGIDISDEMDVRDIIALFNTLIIATEKTASDLEKKYVEYAEINKSSTDFTDKVNEITMSLNGIIPRVTNAIETASDLRKNLDTYYSDGYSETKKDIDAIDAKIKSLSSSIQASIDNAVKNVTVDTDKISTELNNKLKVLDFKGLNELVSDTKDYISLFSKNLKTPLNDIISDLKKEEEKLSDSVSKFGGSAEKIDLATKKINDATAKLNTDIKKINLANYGFVGIFSFVLGITMGTVATVYYISNIAPL